MICDELYSFCSLITFYWCGCDMFDVHNCYLYRNFFPVHILFIEFLFDLIRLVIACLTVFAFDCHRRLYWWIVKLMCLWSKISHIYDFSSDLWIRLSNLKIIETTENVCDVDALGMKKLIKCRTSAFQQRRPSTKKMWIIYELERKRKQNFFFLRFDFDVIKFTVLHVKWFDFDCLNLTCAKWRTLRKCLAWWACVCELVNNIKIGLDNFIRNIVKWILKKRSICIVAFKFWRK